MCVSNSIASPAALRPPLNPAAADRGCRREGARAATRLGSCMAGLFGQGVFTPEVSGQRRLRRCHQLAQRIPLLARGPIAICTKV